MQVLLVHEKMCDHTVETYQFDKDSRCLQGNKGILFRGRNWDLLNKIHSHTRALFSPLIAPVKVIYKGSQIYF